MNDELWKDIRLSGYIHRPLPLQEDWSLERAQQQYQVLESSPWFGGGKDAASNWVHAGVGQLAAEDDGILQLSSPTIMPHWPEGAPADGDYVNFGSSWMLRKAERENWETFNRLAIELKADFHGIPNAYVMIKFRNEGVIPIPDIYEREGVHGVNLKNHEWQTIHLNIEELPRDAITEVVIGYFLNGKERAAGEEMSLQLRSITLERVAEQEVSKGWLPRPREIVFSHSGYRLNSTKKAFATDLKERQFQLKRSERGDTVYTGEIRQIDTGLGSFGIMDFTSFNQGGRYYLQAGGTVSENFNIGSAAGVWQASIWKSLNFIFCERCGYPVPGIHGSCHADIVAEHKGTIISFNGGWHDAGDVSQQLVQTAEVAWALFEMAEQVKARDADLYLRLLEEGEWGLDFILKTRFGDGYRATSAGITRWTDGRIGNMDDAAARVHNQAYENFYCAGIEAYIHGRIPNAALSRRLLEAAREDFQYAMEEFAKHGFDQKPIFWEHTYQSSESLYMATASWAASMLYEATGDEWYGEKAVEFIHYVLGCQELAGIQLDDSSTLRGFFYRHPDKRVIQHFNHQSREHLYLLALTAVHRTQGEHPKADSWLESIKAYGEYLKKLAAYTDPYPMISSGVYHKDEHLDDRSFKYQHLLTDERAKEEYVLQLEQGVKLNDSYYVKRFPVWFSFRGNNAIVLSTGKAASIAGAYLKDRILIDIAEGQLQWIVGKNPFGQSLMYGEGYRYAQQYSVLSGEMTGEIPVGIQTFLNEDEPYWPQFNNATYKEVWTGNAGKWLSIVADLFAIESDR
ncbi:glycoside hydrolase family 9 protein [Paenibacillus sp. GCM10012307]|uniref:Glycoside hydrolase family 9 protein n=1 Tax=Paenibacillus roseus TaxID=2798579 RepID=A0A934J443_9BACL|nr:glycoside hydrolase family 9 protein [Paenibacillus roseus]MBJ6359998.1 glycoside hydrolase family 9 protein [Paenibacillus roseus]